MRRHAEKLNALLRGSLVLTLLLVLLWATSAVEAAGPGKYAPGSIVTLGTYPQGENGEVSPIKWRVLSNQDGAVLLLSQYGLDVKPYNDNYAEVTWAGCSLRRWLNAEFYNRAFSASEKERIVNFKVENQANPEFPASAAEATQDKVFLLSCQEAARYFDPKDREDRRCLATPYAIKRGVYTGKGGFCWWWLRTSGRSAVEAAGVNFNGSIYCHGGGVDYGRDAVRPAVVVKL